MTSTIKQFQRVQRLANKVIQNKNKALDDYEDDVRQFFLECWNLKDHVKNDGSMGRDLRENIEQEVKSIMSMRIVADIATKAKHLIQTNFIRDDAVISNRKLNVHAGPVEVAYGEYNFIIQTDDGQKHDAIQVVKDSVSAWQDILNKYGVIS